VQYKVVYSNKGTHTLSVLKRYDMAVPGGVTLYGRIRVGRPAGQKAGTLAVAEAPPRAPSASDAELSAVERDR
jgi:hypothetical protein